MAHLPPRITRPTNPPSPEGFGWAVVQPRPEPGTDYDPTTHTIQRTLTPEADGWEIVPIVPPEPTPEEMLATARQDMAAVILALPPASRAKFSTAWAGGNTLLDVGDVEGCHALVNAIATDTPEEATAKQTILDALTQFLP